MKSQRRDFLRGLGGFTLSLPFLASLVPSKVYGQSAVKKRFIAIHQFNGIFEAVWYPQQEPSTANGFTAHASDVLYKQLSALPRLADGSLTETFKRDFDPYLSKMNLYRGLDVIGGDDHDLAHFLCGMQDTGASGTMPGGMGASIDTLISKSSNFYEKAPAIRAIRAEEGLDWTSGVSFDRNLSTGSVSRVLYVKKPIDLFNSVFANVITDPAVQNRLASMKLTIGDLVLEDYRSKMNDRRISSEDKARLSNFVDNLQEVQNKLASMSQAQPVTCTKPNKPSNYDYYSLLSESQKLDCIFAHVDIMAAAIACDLTRVAVLSGDKIFYPHDNSHSSPSDRNAQVNFIDHCNRSVRAVSRLLGHLNSMIDDTNTGKTVLDNSLVMWGSEISNGQAHRTESMPVVTFGSGGGSIRTGYYIDYRKRPFFRIADRSDFPAIGRSYSQFLITVMRSMGLQSSEYNSYGDGGGFGLFASNVQYSNGAYEVYRSARNQTLPFISLVS